MKPKKFLNLLNNESLDPLILHESQCWQVKVQAYLRILWSFLLIVMAPGYKLMCVSGIKTNDSKRMKAIIKYLKVVNDLAERYIKDIQECADLAKDSHYREYILILATGYRGVFQDLWKGVLVQL